MADEGTCWDLLRRLCEFPHRGSATAGERLAADRLCAHLEARGHSVLRLPFRAPRTYGWDLLGMTLLLGAGGTLGAWWLALLGALWLWGHFSGWRMPLDDLLARWGSENLFAWARPAEGADGDASPAPGGEPRRLLLVAHYDTAKSFFPFHPRLVEGFRTSFLVNAGLALALPVLAALPWPTLPARLVVAYFLVYAALVLHREITAPLVNGANDNGSGVAVATTLFEELARELPPGCEVGLLLTGCEEVGLRGAKAFLRDGPPREGTCILNIDSVGAGELHFAEGEGMLRYRPFDGPLQEAARDLSGARPLRYRLAYSDALAFARHGYPCLTLIRLGPGGTPPNWHRPTDTIDRIDPGALEETLTYARALAHRTLGIPAP